MILSPTKHTNGASILTPVKQGQDKSGTSGTSDNSQRDIILFCEYRVERPSNGKYEQDAEAA